MQCANNLKQLGLGLHNYADTYARETDTGDKCGCFPAGTIPNPDLDPSQRLSWIVEVLPFLEQEQLYRGIDRKLAWDAPANAAAVQKQLHVLQCADWNREAGTSPAWATVYIGVAGVGENAPTLPAGDPKGGIFGHDRRTMLADVKDGTSNTLLLMESSRNNGPWAQGGPATVRGLDPSETPYLGTGRQFGGTHFSENNLFWHGKSVGCNAALADGSVRFLPEKIAPSVLEALATSAGGDDPGKDW